MKKSLSTLQKLDYHVFMSKGKIKTVLFIPDTHRPYHHYKAYSTMLQIAKSLDLDLIVLLGDYADNYFCSRHPKHASLLQTLTEEIDSINSGLDELDKLFPNINKVFLEGNHEIRLEKYICEKAPALFGITEMKKLMNLDQRKNWVFKPFLPDQGYQIFNSDLWARHVPAANAASTNARISGVSVIHGHDHKFSRASNVYLDGRVITSYGSGWLGDKRKDQVFSYVSSHWQWQLGFSIAYVNTETGQHAVVQIPIEENGHALFNGKLFKP